MSNNENTTQLFQTSPETSTASALSENEETDRQSPNFLCQLFKIASSVFRLCSISGRVLDKGGKGVPGAQIIAADIRNQYWVFGPTITNSDGYYILARIPAGIYMVHIINLSGYRQVSEVVVLDGEQKKGINFVEEHNMSNNQNNGQGRISGRVTDKNENGVNGIQMDVVDTNGNTKSANTTDNEAGQPGYYTISELSEGDYTVKVSSVPVGSDLSLEMYHPAYLSVASGSTVTGIDFSADVVVDFLNRLDDARNSIEAPISIEEANQAVSLFSVVTIMLAGLSRRRVGAEEKIDMLGVLHLYYGLQEDSLRNRLTFGNPTRLWSDLEKELKDLAKELEQLQSDLDFLNLEAMRLFLLGFSNNVLGNVQFPVLFKRYVEIGSDPLLSFDIKKADEPNSFVDKAKIAQADDLLKELKNVILQVVRSLSKYGTAATKRVNEDWAKFEGRALEVLHKVAQERVTPDKDEENIWSVLADLINKNRETEIAPYVVLARHGGKLLKYAMEIYTEEFDQNQLDNFSRDHLRDLFQNAQDSKGFWTERIRSEAAVIKRYPLANWG